MNSDNKLNGGYVVLIIILLICAALSISAFTMFVNKRKQLVLKPMSGGLGQPCIKKASDMGYGCKDGLVCDMGTKTCMAPIKENS